MITIFNSIDRSFLVTQSNTLLERKKHLSLNEQKVILIFASLISPEDTEFKEYSLKASEIINLLEIKNQGKYTELRDTIYSLASKPIQVEKENNRGFTIMQWLSYADYEDGVLRVKFAEELKPYLLELNEYFTKYKLDNVLNLKSKYSFQLYELLKCNAFKKEITLSLEELRSFLNVEDKYPEYKHFKANCIKKAHQEIKDETDLDFEIKEIRQGRKVTHINFKIENNSKNASVKEIEKSNSMDELRKHNVDLLINVFNIDTLSEDDISSILDAAGDDVGKVIQKYMMISNKKDIKNFVGYLINAIKDDYNEISVTKEDSHKTKTKFHNFQDRFENYSNDDLEKIAINKSIKWDKNR